MKNIGKETRAISHDMRQLAKDAHALIAATAEVAGEKVEKSRKRLAATLEQGKEIYGNVCEKTFDSALTTDETMSKYAYHAIGIAVGVFLGYFATRRCTLDRD